MVLLPRVGLTTAKPPTCRSSFSRALTELAQLDKSDLDAALRKVLATDAKLLEVARVSYWELAADHSAIRCRVLYQRDSQTFVEGGELRACDFPAYFDAMLECRTIVANDAWSDPRTSEFVETYFKPHGIRSMLDIPVWRRGQLAGVVCHEHVGGTREWTTDEQDFVLGVGNMISVAVEAVDRRRAEENYELLARAIDDVLWDWDIVRDVIDWNGALLPVFGYRPEEVSPNAQWWLDRVHPEDVAPVKAKLAQLFDSGLSKWNEQYRWIRRDGSVATVMDRGLVLRGDQGTPVRMIGSLVDISERIEMEARLALSDRMASIGTLAAGVAHEINNPLTYITANINQALELLGPGDEIAVLLREAHEGAERVRRIVRDLQMFSRPREEEVENLDVRAVIESSINMAWNEIRHRAQLVKDYGALPHVRMNRARLGQVILNLLINAAQAIPEGHVHLHQIQILTSTTAAGEALIEIRDTGCGIPSDALGRIFEPFFTTKAVGVGTGLGLSICHSIVTTAGGRIELDSPRSGGCHVRVTLPPALAPATRDTASTAPEAAPRRRVLLVDDEPAIRRAIRRMLEAKHDVVVADSGESALEQVRTGIQFDAIICDLMMPHMTGMDLYDRLVADHSPYARRIIFMTGGAFSQRSSEFLAECNCPIVEKPIDRASLHRAIAELVSAEPDGNY